MQLSNLFQEKVLAGLDRQIRELATNCSIDWLDRDVVLTNLCMAPWEIAGAFALVSTDPTAVIDRYGLKAVVTVDLHLCDPPLQADSLENEGWASGIEAFHSIPLFSPLDVWKAWRRREQGDSGIEPPPISCETDVLLRNLNRGYAALECSVDQLAVRAHDLVLLTAALAADSPFEQRESIDKIIHTKMLWRSKAHLDAEAARRYLQRYEGAGLVSLQKALGIAVDTSTSLSVEWVSPSIIPVIESAEGLEEATHRPKWLLYKAIVIQKGRLQEEDHNRMVAEAMNADQYAVAYFEFLKHAPT